MSDNILLIAAVEIALLLLVLCVVLIIQNRSLRQLVQKLKTKAQDVIGELKKAKHSQQVTEPESESFSYVDYVERELNDTIEHHNNLNSNQPIALDIEPGTPLPYRAAALRHAILLAEKDGFAQSDTLDWQALRSRYDQIFRFHEDFPAEASGTDENYDELHKDLQNAKKRISNLEKFKQLYFDLEEQWKASQADATHAMNNLNTIASELDSSGRLNSALDEYQASFDGLSNIFNSSLAGDVIELGSTEGSGVSEEVKQLRAVAADQHRIIQGLQKQLTTAATQTERESVVEGLQTELQKQARFIQESETCIQLLEDELNSAHHDLEQLRSKTNLIPDLKTELVGLRKEHDATELKYHAAISENRKLQKYIKENMANRSQGGDGDESTKLKKQLSELVERYNDLEERFLDLKMQQ